MEEFSTEYSIGYEENSNCDDNHVSATENCKESKDPPMMVPSSNSRSEMAEVSSLLSLAMPTANVNLLVDEGGGKDEAVAIEVRPKERMFSVSLKILQYTQSGL